jgi:hypothetical protein
MNIFSLPFSSFLKQDWHVSFSNERHSLPLNNVSFGRNRLSSIWCCSISIIVSFIVSVNQTNRISLILCIIFSMKRSTMKYIYAIVTNILSMVRFKIHFDQRQSFVRSYWPERSSLVLPMIIDRSHFSLVCCTYGQWICILLVYHSNMNEHAM